MKRRCAKQVVRLCDQLFEIAHGGGIGDIDRVGKLRILGKVAVLRLAEEPLHVPVALHQWRQRNAMRLRKRDFFLHRCLRPTPARGHGWVTLPLELLALDHQVVELKGRVEARDEFFMKRERTLSMK